MQPGNEWKTLVEMFETKPTDRMLEIAASRAEVAPWEDWDGQMRTRLLEMLMERAAFLRDMRPPFYETALAIALRTVALRMPGDVAPRFVDWLRLQDVPEIKQCAFAAIRIVYSSGPPPLLDARLAKRLTELFDAYVRPELVMSSQMGGLMLSLIATAAACGLSFDDRRARIEELPIMLRFQVRRLIEEHVLDSWRQSASCPERDIARLESFIAMLPEKAKP